MTNLPLQEAEAIAWARGVFGEKIFIDPAAFEAAGLGSRSTYYKEVRCGRLIARKLGRRTGSLSTDIIRFLQKLPTLPAKAA
jgi:hypothetical protein